MLPSALVQTEHMIAKLEEVPGVRRFVSDVLSNQGTVVDGAFSLCSQGVPDHKSYVVLFKYYGGGEVDYFEMASNFQIGVEETEAESTTAGKETQLVSLEL